MKIMETWMRIPDSNFWRIVVQHVKTWLTKCDQALMATPKSAIFQRYFPYLKHHVSEFREISLVYWVQISTWRQFECSVSLVFRIHTPSYSIILHLVLVTCLVFQLWIHNLSRYLSQIKMKSGKKMIEITLRSFAIWLSLGEIELVSFQRPLFVPSGTKKIDMEFLHVKGNSWFCCLAFIIVWGWCEISRVFVAGLEFGNHPVSNWNTSTLMVDL